MAVLFDCEYLGNSPFWLVLLITSQALFLVGVYTLLYQIVALPWYWSLYDWFVPSIVSRYYICTRPRLCFWLVCIIYRWCIVGTRPRLCFWLVLPIYTLSSPFVIRRRPRLCFWLVCSIRKAFLSYCGFLAGLTVIRRRPRLCFWLVCSILGFPIRPVGQAFIRLI
jgi:hypothetical protein